MNKNLELFHSFLIKNRAVRRFQRMLPDLNNGSITKNYKSWQDDNESNPPAIFISSSFTWRNDNIGGHKYWDELNSKWDYFRKTNATY